MKFPLIIFFLDLDDYVVKRDKYYSVIIITYDKCTFFANDEIQKAWTWIRDTFLWPKERGQSIMTSDFLLLFSLLNLFLLSEEKNKKVIDKIELTVIEIVKLFKYGKSNKGY